MKFIDNINSLYPEEQDLLKFIKKQNILPLYYKSVEDQHFKVVLRPYYMRMLYYAMKQDSYIKKISMLFSEHEIDYILLKGAYLRQFYVQSNLRTMGDIDILIHSTDLQKAKELLQTNSFIYVDSHEYEHTFKIENIKLELHTALFDMNRSTEYIKMNLDPWENVKTTPLSHQFEMDIITNFTYLIFHSAKHVYAQGAGLRFFYDIFVLYTHKKGELDKKQLELKLTALHLDTFTHYISKMLAQWFDTNDFYLNDCDENTYEEFEKYILNGGIFGHEENQASTAKLRTIEMHLNANGNAVNSLSIAKEMLFPSHYSLKDIFSRYLRWLKNFSKQSKSLSNMIRNQKYATKQQDLIKNLGLVSLYNYSKR